MTGTGLGIGMSLPATGEDIPPIPAMAQFAEAAGFDSVWAGDHLADGRPLLECTLTLAAAAVATSRVAVGCGVLQLALRQPVWAARQISTLAYLAGGRLILGVGTGGSVPAEWQAAGVPLNGRGGRTDHLLTVLPDLLAGKPIPIAALVPPAGNASSAPAEEARVTLTPPVTMPPLWIGGGPGRALRRAAELGDAWLAAATPPAELAAAGRRLAELASDHGRATPAVAVVIIAAGVRARDAQARRDLAAFLSTRLGLPADVASRAAVAGGPEAIADQLGEYAGAGVRHVVLAPFGPNWQQQAGIFAEARDRLRPDGRW